MTESLADKVVLVTGGARRVGAAVTRRLHAAGARVCVHYRSSHTEAHALQAELLAKRPGSAVLLQADLLKPGCAASLVQDTVAAFGRLDALVNNASSFYPTPLGDITEQSWDDLIGTNLKAPLFLSQAAARELRKQRGAIVNIVDIHAERPLPGFLAYTVAKSGLAGLTRALALELAPEVRVNGVSPGAILWPEDGEAFPPAERERITVQTPLRRTGTPEDIAGAVKYLLFDAPFVTGQVLAVDGGRSLAL